MLSCSMSLVYQHNAPLHHVFGISHKTCITYTKDLMRKILRYCHCPAVLTMSMKMRFSSPESPPLRGLLSIACLRTCLL